MLFYLIVAVPENFNLEYHLSRREFANIPHTDEIDFYTGDAVNIKDRTYTMDVDLLKHIASSISTSKVTTLMHRKPEMFKKITEILNELGLVVYYKRDPNAAIISTRYTEEDDNKETFNNSRYLLTCVNVLRIIEDETWNDTLQKVVDLEDYYPPEEVMKQIAEG